MTNSIQLKSIALVLSLLMLMAVVAQAQVPDMMSYQGRVTAGGTNVNGTAWFKFALVNAGGNATYWSNDGSSVGGGAPTDPIEIAVAGGLFTVMLGDASIPNMTEALDAGVFAGRGDARLRIWFSEDGLAFDQLALDQPLSSAPYAMVAAQVPEGAIGAAQLAAGSVSANTIASGAVTADKIAEATITSNKLDWSTMPATLILRGYAENGTFSTPPVASGTNAIALGNENVASAAAATVSGGEDNVASGNYTSIAGGGENRAAGIYAAVGGGRRNEALGVYSFVGGGYRNLATRNFAVVAGGDGNRATNDSAAVVGGISNYAWGQTSFIGGGIWNRAHAELSAIVGGRQNNAHGVGSFVGGGWTNTASSDFSVVAGGQMNVADGEATFVGGGLGNYIETAPYGVIAGGLHNTIVGGAPNIAIGGGISNRAGGSSATIAGGQQNVANGEQSVVGGGLGNAANGYRSAVGGGQSNAAAGSWSTVPGGRDNQAGAYAFAAGHRAKALMDGSFVWGDSTDANALAQVNDSVTMRASGGYRFFSDGGMTLGAELQANATAFSALSDRNAKENFEEIDATEILEKLGELPLTAWNYKADPGQRRYIGPVAQDFHAAFGLGNDTTINTLDADGVALAAIQALYRENQDLKARLERLEALVAGMQEPAIR